MRYMVIVGLDVVQRAKRRHPQTRAWLDNWTVVVTNVAWHSIQDVRKDYPSADGVTVGKAQRRHVVTVFNVGGNDYRMLTAINYARQIVQVMDVLTHAEYSKDRWK
jgi:mRNA interferase HigB